MKNFIINQLFKLVDDDAPPLDLLIALRCARNLADNKAPPDLDELFRKVGLNVTKNAVRRSFSRLSFIIPDEREESNEWEEVENADGTIAAVRRGVKTAAEGMPTRYRRKLGDYIVDEANCNAFELAQEVMAEVGRGAYFWGEPGSGKTFLACITALVLADRGKKVLFKKSTELLTDFISLIRGTQERREEELIKELKEAEVLILDDVGVEKPTGFAGNVFARILDARYEREDGVTLITSNYSLGEWCERLNKPRGEEPTLNGKRIFDRCKVLTPPRKLHGGSRR